MESPFLYLAKSGTTKAGKSWRSKRRKIIGCCFFIWLDALDKVRIGMRWIVKASVALLIFVIALVALAASLAWTGVYNFAAVEPHSKIVQWLVVSAKRQSIARQSSDIKAPLLSDFEWVKVGAQHYDALCVFCHGAPGREASEFSEGLNPPAPELHKVEVQKQYSDAELYWIIKNGIRMTGMPAFGPTHEEKELWAIVAFTRRLPEMQAEDYRVVTERGEQKPPSDKHP